MTEWGRGGRWAGPSHEVLIVTYVAWAAAAGVNLVAVCVVANHAHDGGIDAKPL